MGALWTQQLGLDPGRTTLTGSSPVSPCPALLRQVGSLKHLPLCSSLLLKILQQTSRCLSPNFLSKAPRFSTRPSSPPSPCQSLPGCLHHWLANPHLLALSAPCPTPGPSPLHHSHIYTYTYTHTPVAFHTHVPLPTLILWRECPLPSLPFRLRVDGTFFSSASSLALLFCLWAFASAVPFTHIPFLLFFFFYLSHPVLQFP